MSNLIMFSVTFLLILCGIFFVVSIMFLIDHDFSYKEAFGCFLVSIICGLSAYGLISHFYTDYNVQYEKAQIHTVMKKPDRVIILMKDGTSITSYKIQWLQTKNIYRRTWNEKWSDDRLQQYIYSDKNLIQGKK